MSLAIHGGAGLISREQFSEDELKEYRKSLSEILHSGREMWDRGADALDIVQHCVCLFEDNSLFNAGKGAVFNAEGFIEMDASIMGLKSSSSHLYWGAGVSGLRHVRNPILLANELRKMNLHSLISGEGAIKLAKDHGAIFESEDYFMTTKRKNQYQSFLKNKKMSLDHGMDQSNQEGETVGAVCLDKTGHLAAATSTGGMTGKMVGRVSDSAIIGHGTWAHPQTLAISATGTGDHFVQVGFCHRVHMKMELEKISIDQAIDEALNELHASGGNGGAVAVDSSGNVSMRFNSGGMFRASFDINQDGRETIEIF